MSRGPEAGCSRTLRGPTAGNGTERWRDQTAGSPGPGWGFCPRCLHRWVRLGEVWALTLCMVEDVEDAGEGGGHLGGGGDNHRETCPHLAWKSRQVAGADSWGHRSPSTDEAGREA